MTINALPGAGRGAVIVWTDTTAERTAQRQVRALSRMLLTAHERERQAIARELHDDITQVLAATAIDLSLLPPRVAPAPDEVRTAIARTAERLRKLSKQVQALSHRMHPHALRALGLARALEGECRAFAARTGIGMTTSIRAGKASLSPRIALAAFRIGQEALNNVRKHARAASVRVELDQSPDELRLSIKDTGVGFDRSTGRPGIGLVGMKERALSVGGRIAISSVRGRGTGVTLTVPLGRGRA
jgi:signal transduction histidine kinase